jgi:hypothetical protein
MPELSKEMTTTLNTSGFKAIKMPFFDAWMWIQQQDRANVNRFSQEDRVKLYELLKGQAGLIYLCTPGQYVAEFHHHHPKIRCHSEDFVAWMVCNHPDHLIQIVDRLGPYCATVGDVLMFYYHANSC